MADGNVEVGGLSEGEGLEPVGDEALYRHYVGPNAEKFVPLFLSAAAKEKTSYGINWPVLLFGVPWFFYRKMYLSGLAILLLPILLAVIFPDLAAYSTVGMFGALAASSNSWYVNSGLRRIEKLKALGLSDDELVERVRQAGGVSKPAAFLGTLIIVSAVSLPIVLSVIAKLPECSDPGLRGLATNLVKDALTSQGVAVDQLTVEDFQPLTERSDADQQVCSFTVVLGGESKKLFAVARWADKASGEYQVSIGSTVKEAIDAHQK